MHSMCINPSQTFWFQFWILFNMNAQIQLHRNASKNEDNKVGSNMINCHLCASVVLTIWMVAFFFCLFMHRSKIVVVCSHWKEN